MKLKALLIFLLFFSYSYAKYENSVVRISSMLYLYDYTQPWKEAKRKNVVGSGVIIENQYILTNAHVVLNARKIEVKKANSRKRYYAKIKYISPQADLALLEMYDKKFFNNTKALKISSSVKARDKIVAVGYPEATTKLTLTKGEVAKFKYQPYSLSDEELLSLKLNISIKEGNSGGPILNKKGEVVGIAMQMPEDAPKTAYAIPSLIINSFFEDIKDKKVDGFHSNGNSYQLLENKTVQNYYKVDKKALLVTSVDMEEKQLKVDDVIVKINGYKVANISKLKAFSQFHIKPVGQSITLEVLRAGQVVDLDYKLSYSKKLLHHEYNLKPRYFMFGGLVFTPITRNYLQAVGLRQYEMNMLFYEKSRSLEQEELVAWVEKKFEHKINQGYNSKVEIVKSVNGTKVKSFKHFKKLIKEAKQKYIVIDFIKKQKVVLEKEEAIKSFFQIQKRYRLKGEAN